MSKYAKTLLEFMDQCPPALVRVMALNIATGKDSTLMTLGEIKKNSGLSRRMVERLQFMISWDGIKAGVASKFIEGCRVNIIGLERTMADKRVTRSYFYRHYILKGMPHLNDSQRKRIFELMNWK